MDLVTFSEEIIDKKKFYVCRGYIIVLEPKKLCSLFEMTEVMYTIITYCTILVTETSEYLILNSILSTYIQIFYLFVHLFIGMLDKQYIY